MVIETLRLRNKIDIDRTVEMITAAGGGRVAATGNTATGPPVDRAMSVVGVIVLVSALVLATVVGAVLRARAGRVRRPTTQATETTPNGWDLAGTTPATTDEVLLLQLSSPVCTPCRQTAVQLHELATERPELRHVEIDVAEAPDVARALHVMRTPTTIAFDREGRELLRVAGVPRRTELLDALDASGAESR